jgi:hypothetical protein
MFWGLVERMVRRGRPKDPAAIDQIVVRQLRSLGADLTQARHVRHFLYFDSEADARAAAEGIHAARYDVSVTAPTDEVAQWTVVGEGYRVIGPDTVAGFRALFEQFAADHNGEYDGWEPAAKP